MGFSPVFKIKAFSHNCLPLCSCQSYLWWAWPLQSPGLSCPPKLLVQPLMLLLPSQPPLSPLGLFYHFLSKNILYTCIIEPSKKANSGQNLNFLCIYTGRDQNIYIKDFSKKNEVHVFVQCPY